MAQIQVVGDSWKITGPLSFDTANALLLESHELCQQGELPSRIDLQDVSCADSAGLALLVEWLRQAELKQHQVVLDNFPKQLIALAEISDLGELLKIGSKDL